MYIVALRANLEGRSDCENHPQAVRKCLALGFGAEVDLWTIDGEYWLGHDRPTYPIKLEEFDRDGVFFHLKTPFIPILQSADAFAIDHDTFVVTIRGRIWANYGHAAPPHSIMCAPDLVG